MSKKLEWYAFYQEFNAKQLRYTNVIRDDLIDRVKKAIKKDKTYEEIKDIIDGDFMYHYYSKCEYEVIVSNLTGSEMEQKIDIYYQLKPNIDRITEYMIKELTPKKRESNK